MNAIVPVNSLGQQNPLAGLRLEQTSNGHIATPWFTFDWQGAGIAGPADMRSRYHQIIPRAMEAFMSAIGSYHEPSSPRCIVSQYVDPATGDQLFRLSTTFKKQLPAPPKKQPDPENVGAIEI